MAGLFIRIDEQGGGHPALGLFSEKNAPAWEEEGTSITYLVYVLDRWGRGHAIG